MGLEEKMIGAGNKYFNKTDLYKIYDLNLVNEFIEYSQSANKELEGIQRRRILDKKYLKLRITI